jgi:uncharacterized protein YndB with AHSA1/START domain
VSAAPFRLRVTRRFAAAPERVFDAWLDPGKIRLWFSPELGEMTRIQVDPRPGGTFSFMQRRDGEDVDHVGTYIAIERPRHLAFTWSVPKHSSDESIVTIDIVPDGDGCLLTLTHEMDARWKEWSERTEKGWKHLLDGIARAIA